MVIKNERQEVCMEDSLKDVKLEIRDIVVLEDNHTYAVTASAILENVEYYFLVDINNSQNIKIGYQDKEEIVMIEDQAIIKSLMPKFGQSVIKTIKELLPSEKNTSVDNS